MASVEFDTSKNLSTNIVDGSVIGAGFIWVYGGWFESRSTQIQALIILLLLVSVSVVFALVGESLSKHKGDDWPR